LLVLHAESHISSEQTQEILAAESHFQSLYGVLLNPPLNAHSMRRENI